MSIKERDSIDIEKFKRTRIQHEEEPEKEPEPVTAGTIDKVIDLAFNPTRDKIREVTIIDRMQGRLLPQLDLINLMWQYVIEIAMYRQDSEAYIKMFAKENKKRPVPPDLINEFMYRTAQWQKSVAGKNLERATDIALAETETKNDSMEYGDVSGGLNE